MTATRSIATLRRALIGPFWSVVEYAWYPLLLLLTTPFFLHRLGTEAYGHWALLTATIGFGALLSVGTGAATVRAVAHGVATKDGVGVAHLVRGSLAIGLGGGIVLALFILGSFALGSGGFLSRMGTADTILLTGATAAIIALIEQVENVFTATLRGGERFRTIAKIEICVRSLQIAACLVAVVIWGTLAALYLALILTALTRLAVRVVIVQRWLRRPLLRPSFNHARGILHDAGWGWLQGAGALIFGVADRFIIGSAIGAAALAHYAVATQLAQPLHALSAAAASVIFPKVSRALASGEQASVRRLLLASGALQFSVVTVLAAGLLIFRMPILTLWLGQATALAAAPTLAMLTIAFWLLSITVIPHFALLGLGRMRFVAVANLLAGIATMAAMAAAVGVYGGSLFGFTGIVGIAAARIVYGATMLVNFIPLTALRRPSRGAA
jgi:O-antigen/teichoic acid export membrane protein